MKCVAGIALAAVLAASLTLDAHAADASPDVNCDPDRGMVDLEHCPEVAARVTEPGSAGRSASEPCALLPERGDAAICADAFFTPPLRFPREAEEPGLFTNRARMGIFKPEGSGPFPVLVLLHSCATVDYDPQQMPYWVDAAVERGYVAFVVDSWRQRGASEGNCARHLERFAFDAVPARMRDAHEALAHIASFPFADASRAAVMGFSQGGRTAYLSASRQAVASIPTARRRFRAAVSVYGACFLPRIDYFRDDADIPTLSLMGDLDVDADPQDCVPRLQRAKAKGAPVEWHVYAGGAHAWDSVRAGSGVTITQFGVKAPALFRFDARIRDDSRDRAFALIQRHLAPRRPIP